MLETRERKFKNGGRSVLLVIMHARHMVMEAKRHHSGCPACTLEALEKSGGTAP
jgi:hypothetical protein